MESTADQFATPDHTKGAVAVLEAHVRLDGKLVRIEGFWDRSTALEAAVPPARKSEQ
jgi:hypothetical protein